MWPILITMVRKEAAWQYLPKLAHSYLANFTRPVQEDKFCPYFYENRPLAVVPHTFDLHDGIP